jgi:hypothetical protein
MLDGILDAGLRRPNDFRNTVDMIAHLHSPCAVLVTDREQDNDVRAAT